MSSLNKQVGARIAAFRIESGLTQEKVGHELGVEQSTVARWEAGKGLPPGPTIEALANLLGVRWTDFFNVDAGPIPRREPSPEEALTVISRIVRQYCSGPILQAAEPSNDEAEAAAKYRQLAATIPASILDQLASGITKVKLQSIASVLAAGNGNKKVDSPASENPKQVRKKTGIA